MHREKKGKQEFSEKSRGGPCRDFPNHLQKILVSRPTSDTAVTGPTTDTDYSGDWTYNRYSGDWTYKRYQENCSLQ